MQKSIFKNTLLLYIRMMFVMVITLYTSRVVLKELGVSDFGTYSLIAGIVAMMGLFNGAMSSASQRFFAYNIGRKNNNALSKTYNVSLSIHYLLGLLIFVFAETLGLWYINNIMIFPSERTFAVNIVYQFSILTFILGVIQVPYLSLIIAKEKMNVFALISTCEALMKLLLIILLPYFEYDKLIVYSILLFFLAFLLRFTYYVYCSRFLKVGNYTFFYDKKMYNEILSYSGWSMFGNVSALVRTQGSNILLNYFFGTIINASYGLVIQVQNAVLMFVNSFQMAVNPRIVKLYAANDSEDFISLLFKSSKLSFMLTLLIIFPLYIHTEFILSFWLSDNFPPNTVEFLRLLLISLLIECLSGSIMTAVQATGKVKWYQIVIGTTIILNLPINYILLKLGFSANIVFVVLICISFLSLVLRMYFIKHLLKISLRKYLHEVLKPVTIISILVICLGYLLLNFSINRISSFPLFFLTVFSEILFCILLCLIFGIDNNEKKILYKKIKWIILKK